MRKIMIIQTRELNIWNSRQMNCCTKSYPKNLHNYGYEIEGNKKVKINLIITNNLILDEYKHFQTLSGLNRQSNFHLICI